MGNGGGSSSFIRNELKLPEIPPQLPKGEFVESDNKEDPYMWYCDGCRKSGTEFNKRFRWADEDYDLCGDCKAASENPIPDAAKVPTLAILDLQKGSFYTPLDGKTAITKENISALAEDLKNGDLTVQ